MNSETGEWEEPDLPTTEPTRVGTDFHATVVDGSGGHDMDWGEELEVGVFFHSFPSALTSFLNRTLKVIGRMKNTTISRGSIRRKETSLLWLA